MKKATKTQIKKMEDDFIGKGFKKIDRENLSVNPPKIKWGKEFEAWDLEKQNRYLKKLASTMNHAADLIQTERNGLLKLMDLKEKQVEKAKKAMEANDAMVHTEIEKMNEERRKINSNGRPMRGAELKEYLKGV